MSDESAERPCPACGSVEARTKYLEPPFRVVQCGSCSLVYLANPPDEPTLYEEYHARTQAAVDSYRSDSHDKNLAELYAINAQRMAMVMSAKSSGKLLDIGCGRGFFMKTARESGFQVSGIDVSNNAVGYARDILGLVVSTDSLDQLISRREQFDLITAWHVLEHFIDPIGTLRSIRTLLAENGICFVEVPNLNSLKFQLARNKWEGGNHPLYHRSFFTSGTLHRAFLNAGFSAVKRLQLSYRIPGRSAAYGAGKRLLNALSLDAFLDFRAGK